MILSSPFRQAKLFFSIPIFLLTFYVVYRALYPSEEEREMFHQYQTLEKSKEAAGFTQQREGVFKEFSYAIKGEPLHGTISCASSLASLEEGSLYEELFDVTFLLSFKEKEAKLLASSSLFDAKAWKFSLQNIFLTSESFEKPLSLRAKEGLFFLSEKKGVLSGAVKGVYGESEITSHELHVFMEEQNLFFKDEVEVFFPEGALETDSLVYRINQEDVLLKEPFTCFLIGGGTLTGSSGTLSKERKAFIKQAEFSNDTLNVSAECLECENFEKANLSTSSFINYNGVLTLETMGLLQIDRIKKKMQGEGDFVIRVKDKELKEGIARFQGSLFLQEGLLVMEGNPLVIETDSLVAEAKTCHCTLDPVTSSITHCTLYGDVALLWFRVDEELRVPFVRAISDEARFSIEDKTVLLLAKENVYLIDEPSKLKLRADQVRLSQEDPLKGPKIEGIGLVHFDLTQDEVRLLKERWDY